MNLTDRDIDIINTKIGLKYLFADKKTSVEKALRNTKYELELKKLQARLIRMQEWIIANNKKVIFIFEGRDAAGKGGAIRRITAHINPRFYNIVALPKPTEVERSQWYFQRYSTKLPNPGQIVFFDRSWYNRAVVEPVNGFCTLKEYQNFMSHINEYERMIIESDTYLVKFYLSISKEEQQRRFNDIMKSPLKKWKMTPVDMRAQELWDEYTKYKEAMFEHTNTDIAPWTIIHADKKPAARIEIIKHILNVIPFEPVVR